MKSILIVEDEPSIARSLEFLMAQQGHAVRVVEDGAAAMEALAADPPDLVLLDVMLPSRSGFDICETVRAQPEWDGIKIVIITAKGRDVDVERGFSLGADDYVTKPFAIQDVVQTVQTLLGG